MGIFRFFGFFISLHCKCLTWYQLSCSSFGWGWSERRLCFKPSQRTSSSSVLNWMLVKVRTVVQYKATTLDGSLTAILQIGRPMGDWRHIILGWNWQIQSSIWVPTSVLSRSVQGYLKNTVLFKVAVRNRNNRTEFRFHFIYPTRRKDQTSQCRDDVLRIVFIQGKWFLRLFPLSTSCEITRREMVRKNIFKWNHL